MLLVVSAVISVGLAISVWVVLSLVIFPIFAGQDPCDSAGPDCTGFGLAGYSIAVITLPSSYGVAVAVTARAAFRRGLISKKTQTINTAFFLIVGTLWLTALLIFWLILVDYF